jgi:hypothetical protein
VRNIIAFICVVAALPAGAFAQATRELAAPRVMAPLSRSIESAGAGLRRSLSTQDRMAPEEWAQLRQTRPGTELVVTTKDQASAKVRLLFASDSILFVLDPTDVKLERRVERVLIQLTESWPGLFSGTVPYRQIESVRVSKAGVFDRGTKIGDLSQVVRTMAREDVNAIGGLAPAAAALPAAHAHSRVGRGALIGLGIGFGAGVVLGLDVGMAIEGHADATGAIVLGGLGAGFGAGIGAGIGALVGKAPDARAARSFAVAPMVTRRAGGLLVKVGF